MESQAATQGAGAGAGGAWIIPILLWRLIRFVFYDLPAYMVGQFVGLLGKQLSFTLRFSSLVVIIVTVIALVTAVVRYRYLNVYSRLPPEETRSDPNMDIFLGPMDGEDDTDRKSSRSTYLDDFLSGIKVFGYLDRKMFHELTKHMRTHKIESGELFLLKDLRGFAIAVDGCVDVFAKIQGNEFEHDKLAEDFEEIQGENYRLLNSVKKGAPISSLFTILSLFTDNLRDPDLDIDLNQTSSQRRFSEFAFSDSPSGGESFRQDRSTPVSHNSAPPSGQFTSPPLHKSNGMSNANNYFEQPDNGLPSADRQPSGAKSRLQTQESETEDGGYFARRSKTDFEILHEQILVRAKTHATIAVIPEEAFTSLASKYPKSTAHIVQLILTHCQRVTFQTCHNYLHLTPEIFKIEEQLNRQSAYDIPAFLHDSAITRLKDRAKAVHGDAVVTLKPRKSHHTRTKSSTLQTGSSTAASSPSSKSMQSQHVVLEPDQAHPGDLLSNIPLSKRHMLASQPTSYYFDLVQLKDSITSNMNSQPVSTETSEDQLLRTTLADSILKMLGFTPDLLTRSRQRSYSMTSTLSFPSSREGSMSTPHLGPLRSGVSLDSPTPVVCESSTTDDTNTYTNAQRIVSDKLDISFYKQGSVLFKQDERCPGLFYVIDGVLEVGFKAKNKPYRKLHNVYAGGVAGVLGSILGYRSYADVRAKSDVYIAFVPRSIIESLTDRYPSFYLGLAKTLTSVLTRFLIHLDFALEWIQVPAGAVIYNQGDNAEALYFVLNGRVRAIERNTSNNTPPVVEEFGQGTSVGEIEVLTSTKYIQTLHAIRESELVRFPRSLFETLTSQYPLSSIELTRKLASRIRAMRSVDATNGISDTQMATNNSNNYDTSSSNILPLAPNSSYKTVAVVPITAGLPVTEFAEKLFNGFHDNGVASMLLNNATMLTYLGRNAFNKMGLLKLSGYLSDLEERYEVVIYVADAPINSPWTRKCLSQADCVLMLADALSEPTIGEYERLLIKTKITARADLVLLHPDRYVVPGSTAAWLKNRLWINTHHHVQMQVKPVAEPGNTSVNGKMGRNRLQRLKTKMHNIQTDLVSKYRSHQSPVSATHFAHKNDFNRLARILSGKAVGLVLGGGGARGVAHIGVIKALEEYGIPIDFIGGTSIGSFVGGLYARYYDLVPIYGRAKKFAFRVASLWRMVLDLTYPATSYTTGHEFNRGIWKTFGDSRIEDFWLEFYTNTTNITHSRMEIHNSGYAWRYIRASMSLAGLLPPLTDKGSMLLDGGYVDNLTVSEMRTRGAKTIFAVDVGSIDDTTPMQYGDTLSGLWVILNRWNPFSNHPNVPNLAEIQQRLAYVSSVGALQRAKATPGVLYLRPPIDNFATLDFGKFDEIYTIGSKFAHDQLEEWSNKGKLSRISGMANSTDSRRTRVNRRNSI